MDGRLILGFVFSPFHFDFVDSFTTIEMVDHTKSLSFIGDRQCDFVVCLRRLPLIHSVRLRGQYAISGYLLGSLVALVVADKLKKTGQVIAHLIIFDNRHSRPNARVSNLRTRLFVSSFISHRTSPTSASGRLSCQ